MAKKKDDPIGSAQRQSVQRSFAKVEPIAEAAAALFYNKLFDLDLGLKALFKTAVKGDTADRPDRRPGCTTI